MPFKNEFFKSDEWYFKEYAHYETSYIAKNQITHIGIDLKKMLKVFISNFNDTDII